MGITDNWTKENLAWAAGLFEGEGCITKNGSSQIRVSLGMTDLDVVQKFHRIVGVGAIQPKPRLAQGRKPYWSWSVYKSEHVQALIAAFWGFLGERRKAKAAELLLMWAAHGPRKSNQRFCKRGHEYTEENTYRFGGSRQCRQCRNMHMDLLRERTKTNGDLDIRRAANSVQ